VQRNRRMDWLIASLALAPSVTTPVGAQVTFRATAREFRDLTADVYYLWTSAARAERRDWLGMAAVGAGFGALLAVDDQVDHWIVEHPRSVIVRAASPFRESHRELARLPTARRLIPVSAALVAIGMATDNPAMSEAGYGCLTGWALSSTLRYATYAGVSRERPGAADGDQFGFHVPGGTWNQHSFFAGHTANSFACVTFWSERFHLGVAEPALYAVATGISLARMADRRHWASDTFLGAVVGYATARTIDSRYDRRERRRRAVAGTTPTPTVLLVIWEARF
jgi:membrane-associated phospholipid phosphatase